MSSCKLIGTFFFFLITALFIALPASAQSTTPEIGIYTDEGRTTSSVETTGPYQYIDAWIFCKPGDDGAYGSEFMLEYSPNMFMVSNTLNPFVMVTMGTLETGMSFGYSDCQEDWHWLTQFQLFQVVYEHAYARIVPHPDTDLIKVVSCPDPRPWEVAVSGAVLSINAQLDDPWLIGAKGIDYDEIHVKFDKTVDPVTSETTANYEVAETLTPLITFPVVAAELQPGSTTVKLTLGTSMTIGTQYSVRVSNVKSTIGLEIPEGSEIPFVLDEPVSPTLDSLIVQGPYVFDVIFSEYLDEGTAEQTGNYALYETGNPSSPFTVIGAELQYNGTTVRIDHEGVLVHNGSYTLQVSNVEDSLGYAIDPGSEIEFIYSDIYPRGFRVSMS